MTANETSEEREEQILNAAIVVFARQGFSAARMDDIGQEAGLSKGTLYWYFKSKDAIVSAILSRVFEGELKKLQKLPGSAGTVTERLLTYLRQYSREIVRLAGLMPLLLDFYAMATRQQSVRECLQGYYRGYRAVLKILLQEGIESGEFRQVDLEQTAISLIATIDGLILAWSFDPETVPLERECEFAAHLVLEGLRAR